MFKSGLPPGTLGQGSGLLRGPVARFAADAPCSAGMCRSLLP